MTNLRTHIKLFVAASLLFLTILSIQPLFGGDLGNLYDQLAQAQTQQEADSLAREIAHEHKKSGSQIIDLLLEQGENALERGAFNDAIAHFTAVIDHAPNFPSGWYHRAYSYVQLQQFGPAIADLENVLALDERYFPAILGLAQIFEILDRPKLALRAYDQVLTIHPFDMDVISARERIMQAIQGQAL